ncbi:MAG: hypothetical protein ABIJ43_02285 [Candidatus Beckwithbacteria bacterium]|nr:hypothetical protein [Patescibacteria group bacterium]
MKVFFAASPKGLTEFREEYNKIYKTIEELGHKNVTDIAISVEPEDHYKISQDKLRKHYKKVIDSIKKADVVIIEGSISSLAVGYVVDRAIESSKPVVILHTSGREPFFLTAINNDKVQVIEYTATNAKKQLATSINYAQEQMDTRFNFFISSKIGNYLDWIAKKRKVPRAVYLRKLIQEDMKRDVEYRNG